MCHNRIGTGEDPVEDPQEVMSMKKWVLKALEENAETLEGLFGK